MTKKWQVAVVGAGIGKQHITAFCNLSDCFHIRYVCDLNIQRAQEASGALVNCEVVSDFTVALADPSIDLIDICLPPKLHFWATEAALKAGKHVICEKPLTASLQQIQHLQSLSHSVGKSVFPIFQYRYGLGYRQIHALKTQGLLGKPYTLSMETHWKRGADYYAEPWRGTWQGELGGVIVSHACHAHNLATHLVGNIVEVAAMLDTRVNAIETEDCAALSMRSKQGALITSSITVGAADNSSRFRAIFEHATVTSGRTPYHVGAPQWTIEASNPDKQAALDAAIAQIPDIPIRFDGLFADIHNKLSGRADLYLPSLQEGYHSIELITAIYLAARSKTTVALPLPPDSKLTTGWIPNEFMHDGGITEAS